MLTGLPSVAEGDLADWAEIAAWRRECRQGVWVDAAPALAVVPVSQRGEPLAVLLASRELPALLISRIVPRVRSLQPKTMSGARMPQPNRLLITGLATRRSTAILAYVGPGRGLLPGMDGL
jgi:hypothetical protein